MRVDHLVWYSPDLGAGEAHLERLTNTKPIFGGIHPGEGTRNALLSLGEETYLEILAPDPDQSETARDPELRALSGAGLYHWAAGGAELNSLREQALAAGLDGSDIVTGGRALPDGGRLQWSLFGIRNHAFGALVPFFIDWTGSEHPAKTVPRCGRVLRIDASTREPEGLTAVYDALGLGMVRVRKGQPGLAVTLETAGGEHTLAMLDQAPRGFVI